MSSSCQVFVDHLRCVWSRARSNGRCDGQTHITAVDSRWPCHWFTSCWSVVPCWLGPTLCVCVRRWRREFALFSSAGGWPGRLNLDDWARLWCVFDSYSGTSLSSNRPLCAFVCMCVCVSVCMWSATSPDTTSACNHTCRQLCIQTASIAHTFYSLIHV